MPGTASWCSPGKIGRWVWLWGTGGAIVGVALGDWWSNCGCGFGGLVERLWVWLWETDGTIVGVAGNGWNDCGCGFEGGV